MKFCRRELRRGNRYDAIVLDPPSYGHGPKGEDWQIKRDLLPLLELCGQLTEGRPAFMLLTCHTPGFDPKRLRQTMIDALVPTGNIKVVKNQRGTAPEVAMSLALTSTA